MSEEPGRGDLIRRGLLQPAQAQAHLSTLSDPDFWLARLSGAMDADLALATISKLAAQAPRQLDELLAVPEAVDRLVALVGGSQALAAHLLRYPDDLAELVSTPRAWTRDELVAEVVAVIGSGDDSTDLLRVANKRALLRIAARDLCHPHPSDVLPSIARELSDLADAIMHGALEIARRQVPDHARTRLAIIAMGKCGAQELNYISDVDVIFVAEPADDQTSTEQAVTIASRLAAAVVRICAAFTPHGSIWQVDAGLRPEGNAGQLVRSLWGMASYYDKWASNWEFQALLKARPMAGDLDLGQQFCDQVGPLVWHVAEREGFMAQTQAMRRRVVDLIPAKEASREIKLGSGGLRDTEFTVQLLQLVHGKADERLRLRGTLETLRALSDATYIGRADAAEMDAAYRFQRLLEHRVQLYKLRRTHLLPANEDELRILARGVGLATGEEVVRGFRDSARTVLRLHQRVFYSPLLETVASIDADSVRLSPEAARARMAALGFADPAAAMRHIQALTTGVNRAAQIQRQLMPAMLGWFAQAPNPDAGLLAFRRVSESLKDSPWYLRALRDEGRMASILAHILAASAYAVDLLKRNPESVQVLAHAEDLQRPGIERIRGSMSSVIRRHDLEQDAITAVRAIRRRELFRVAVADMTDVNDLAEVGYGLTDIASATVEAALEVARREVEGAPDIGVVAMGRWGGREMAYASDCDSMFGLAGGDPGAQTAGGARAGPGPGDRHRAAT